MEFSPQFSIITPTLNEEKYLPKLLADLEKQTLGTENFEVIIVDGQSTDKTPQVTAKFKHHLKLQFFSFPQQNVAAQRNFGADKGEGDWFIFMDADNRLPKNFLTEIKRQLRAHPDTDIFTTWTNPETDSSWEKTITRLINLSCELYKAIDKYYALGALIGCRRTVANQVKFAEKQKVFEDSFFIQDAVEKGYNFQVFRQPRFVFSLRRLKRDGLLKMVGTVATLQLKYLQGGDFSQNNYGYEMLGGGYYDQQRLPYVKKIDHFLRNASQKQLQQVKKMLITLAES